MNRFARTVALNLLLTTTLVACSEAAPDPAPSAECIEEMEFASTFGYSGEEDSPYEDSITRTLEKCQTADLWVEALTQRPGAMGLNERAEIGDMDLQVACFRNAETPVCKDAHEQDRL